MEARKVTPQKIIIQDFLTCMMDEDVRPLELFLEKQQFTSVTFENFLNTKLGQKPILVLLRKNGFDKHLNFLYEVFKKVFIERELTSLYWDLFFGKPLKDIIEQRKSGKEFYHPNHISRFDDLNKIALDFALAADRFDFLEHLFYIKPSLKKYFFNEVNEYEHFENKNEFIKLICLTNQPEFFGSNLTLFKATQALRNVALHGAQPSILSDDYKKTLEDSKLNSIYHRLIK